jgi:hypothetical protein
MRRRLYTLLAATLSMGLGGCAQMTRHSNTLVFGTNTSVGISVGVEATNTPGITVGYKRQEAVIMPLVANTSDDGKIMKPCVQLTNSGDLPENCLLRGKGRDQDGKLRDTYSVFASFGAKFSGGSGAGSQNADGQIAQYFATGLAARELARNGGAAAVALGSAAKENARVHASHELADAIMSPEVGTAAVLSQSVIDAAKAAVATNISTSDNFQELLKRIDAPAGANTATLFQTACTGLVDADKCADAVGSSPSLAGLQEDQWKKAAAIN